MRVHAIQTGRVRIKASQIAGRGHGLRRRLAPLTDEEWSDWLPTLRLCDRASRRRDPRRYGRLRRLEAPAALASLFPACGAVRHRAGGGGTAAASRDRHRRGRREAGRPHPYAHRSRRRTFRRFRRARCWSAPGEIAIASGLAGRLRGYLPERWPKELRSEAAGARGRRLRAIRPLAIGLTEDGAIVAVATPGHTRDHLSVIVEDGDAAVFIAGDASYTEEAMLSGPDRRRRRRRKRRVPTLAAIRAFAASRPTIYLPAHDPDAATRLAERRTGAALGERINTSSGNAQSETSVISRKSLE